jgi:hypothetical protein
MTLYLVTAMRDLRNKWAAINGTPVHMDDSGYSEEGKAQKTVYLSSDI